jgi:hypothetical protein
MTLTAASDSRGKSITIERAIQAFKAEFSEHAALNTQKWVAPRGSTEWGTRV